MRLLLSKDSRKRLFYFLKKKRNAKNFSDLSKKINVSLKTLKKWMYAELYLPDKIIPNDVGPLEILDKQENKWGAIKGGKTGGKRCAEVMKHRLGKEAYSYLMAQRGKKTINTLYKRYKKEDLMKLIFNGKMKKRELQSKKLEQENDSFFTNNKVIFDLEEVNYSKIDRAKHIMFPKEMTKELAEEIGIHLGDGCMSYNKNYFSVKTNKKEERYVTDFLFPLYKKLYNLDLKLMRLRSVSGFEVYSKAICEFKNKIIGLPYGKKVERIEIPQSVLETKNKEVYRSLIRGLFDTDGNVSVIRGNYPRISITIKSRKLIEKLNDILRKMGFIPYSNSEYLSLNGPTMFKKWLKEINSNNPKNINKLNWANSLVG
ncbi:hypothetical protein HYU07_00685 [Candidatus Woesearchaeota archaeon]|nr:hypothetical protein [Candidatus Woesearchaeota archaeon]